MVERIPPHNEEAEKNILGACMIDSDVVGDIISMIKPEDLYNEKHREIFNAIQSLYRSRTSVDILTVSEELKKRKALELAGGRAYVASLAQGVVSVSNAIDYAKIVVEKAMLRDLIKINEVSAEQGYSQERDAKDIIEDAERDILSISQERQQKDIISLQDVLVKNLETIDELSQNPDKLAGIPTGYKKLDEQINGLQKTDLIIVAARPSMGKTAFALNIALNAATKSDKSVLVFSLEMTDEQLGMRLLSMQARVESEKLNKGRLDSSDWERISFATDELQKAKIGIDATPGIKMTEIRNKCRRKKASKEGLDLIIVDYLGLMEGDTKSESRQQEISGLSRQFKQLAREMDCPIILLCQLNRGPEARTDHRPNMADIRESGAIEQDADIIMFLYRDDFYNPNTEKPGVCEVIVSKNRRGAIGTTELTWVAMYTKFSDKAM